MRWDLIVTGGPSAGKNYSVYEGQKRTLGRSSKADFTVKDKQISRVHCSISVEDALAVLRDEESRNGTYVNKKKIDVLDLQKGDVIYIGSTVIEVEPVETGGSSLMIPERMVGPFRLVYRIGIGGMATVYLSERLPGREKFALKLLKPSLGLQEEFIERFHREARAGFRLSHPNIVKTHEIGRDGNTVYLVMEYCPGDTLAQVLDREKKLPLARALLIASQIAEALKHAHRHEIVHRDIKPENIIISKKELVKVSDFGLAKFLNRSAADYLTHTGEGLGTLRYLPPEQINDARASDVRADIYSLGATLYHMVSGSVPLEESNLEDFFRSIAYEPPRNLRKIDKTLPKSLAALVAKCLAKHPEQRYQTPDELARELGRIQDEVS